ncbi:DUF305 domain-containing protein [Georgenia sp. EYE_87]|uniref:DUF305 domain-containing protein n=1 Tax=Georgenia sp. EYE_87 TaxID=2853448 RepID=UPI002005159A|nr:DUF305 domain-containing protein [Georgenia sp. EYE_87]MCK6210167.1 DUF305 domain-containing protein [Georgenia sp. EYE_87]
MTNPGQTSQETPPLTATDTAPQEPQGPERTGAPSARLGGPLAAAVVVLVAAVAAVVGLLVGSRLGAVDATEHPAEGSVDVGFARDMQDHHGQAVQMATLVRDRTDDEAIRSIALDITLTQQHQAGQMFAWLEEWGLPQSSTEPPMLWMADHGDHADAVAQGGLMPGMATQAELNQLAAASGEDAERLFLTLMIEHHEAGVDMAEYAVDDAKEDVVTHLAATIVQSQSAELTVLQDLLAARGGPPE